MRIDDATPTDVTVKIGLSAQVCPFPKSANWVRPEENRAIRLQTDNPKISLGPMETTTPLKLSREL